MKYFLLVMSFFSMNIALAGDASEIHVEKMPIVSFQGEGGGWDPSIVRCRFARDLLAEYISFTNENGFISFTGECTKDSFDPEWPKNLFFASILKANVRTNLPKGQYSSQFFCLKSRSISRIASLVSTKKINIVLSEDESITCEDKEMSRVRFDIYID